MPAGLQSGCCRLTFVPALSTERTIFASAPISLSTVRAQLWWISTSTWSIGRQPAVDLHRYAGFLQQVGLFAQVYSLFPVQAQQDFVSISGRGQPGLTIANRGLPEYQVLGNTYHLTLLRATGKVGDWGTFPSSPSRLAHLHRSGEHNAHLLVVPRLGSQEQGLHGFEYSVAVNYGDGAYRSTS